MEGGARPGTGGMRVVWRADCRGSGTNATGKTGVLRSASCPGTMPKTFGSVPGLTEASVLGSPEKSAATEVFPLAGRSGPDGRHPKRRDDGEADGDEGRGEGRQTHVA